MRPWGVVLLTVVLLLVLITSVFGYRKRIWWVGETSWEQPNAPTHTPGISADGQRVLFVSAASNLTFGPIRDQCVFRRDMPSQTIWLVSQPNSGGVPNDACGRAGAALSADGRLAVFDSPATNLVSGDTNQWTDVFVRDIAASRTERVSVSTSGRQGNGHSGVGGLDISGSGHIVAFASDATTLVGNDTNGRRDVYIRNRATGHTARVSVGEGGVEGNGDSWEPRVNDDGSRVVFTSDSNNLVPNDTNNHQDIFLYQRGLSLRRVSLGPGGVQANEDCWGPAIDGSGRYVVYHSAASNLVAGDHNGLEDVFLCDLLTGTTRRVNLTAAGAEANGATHSGRLDISANGRMIIYASDATNLATDDNAYCDVFLYDQARRKTRVVTFDAWPAEASSYNPCLSADGAFAAFESVCAFDRDDRNGGIDVYWRECFGFGDPPPSAAEDMQPANGAVGVQRDGNVIVTFRTEVDQASAEGHFSLRTMEGASLPGRFIWIVASKKLRFNPRDLLGPRQTYVVHLTRGLRRSDGTKTTFGERFCFTTGTQPTSAAQVLVASATAASGGAGGVDLVVTLTAPADLQVEVRNLAGRVVRSLALDLPAKSGVNHVLWDGRSDHGLRVPAGRYLLQITARSSEGTQASAMAVCQLQR